MRKIKCEFILKEEKYLDYHRKFVFQDNIDDMILKNHSLNTFYYFSLSKAATIDTINYKGIEQMPLTSLRKKPI